MVIISKKRRRETVGRSQDTSENYLTWNRFRKNFPGVTVTAMSAEITFLCKRLVAEFTGIRSKSKVHGGDVHLEVILLAKSVIAILTHKWFAFVVHNTVVCGEVGSLAEPRRADRARMRPVDGTV